MSNRLFSLTLGLGLLAVPSCNLDIPDLNNPGLDQLQTNPTPGNINAAATGLLVLNRGGKSAPTGLVNQLGILGRESYDFDPNDGRFVTELIQGTLQKGSPFGGVLWAGNYLDIRTGNVILHALDKLNVFDTAANAPAQKSSMKGFVHTIQATEFLGLYLTHFDTGAPIDVDEDLGAPLGAVVSKEDVLKETIRLLDLGQMELQTAVAAASGGDKFTFKMSPGYQGFDTPKTFLTFNRALRAKVAVLAKDYATAVTLLMTNNAPTFVNDDPTDMAFSFNTGVFYSYSTGAGDATNGLFSRPSVVAHASFLKDVAMKPDPMDATKMVPADARYLAKIVTLVDDKGNPSPATNTNDPTLTTPIGFNIYNSASSPIAVIRNEELILLKAEALWFNNQHTAAVTELNIVRQNSGKLPALDPAMITDDTAFVHALLYERQYSLMYEGGHRWIDLRRFAIQFPTHDEYKLPLDDPMKHKRNERFPIPQAECDARAAAGTTEPACNIKSTDPLPAN